MSPDHILRGAFFATLVLCTLNSPDSIGEAKADTLIVQGSTTFARRLMERLEDKIEAETGHELTVIPNKSLPGLVGLIEGRAHMAMISAPLQEERDALQKIELVATGWGQSVHPGRPGWWRRRCYVGCGE